MIVVISKFCKVSSIKLHFQKIFLLDCCAFLNLKLTKFNDKKTFTDAIFSAEKAKPGEACVC